MHRVAQHLQSLVILFVLEVVDGEIAIFLDDLRHPLRKKHVNKFGGNLVLHVSLRHYGLPSLILLHRVSLGQNILRDNQALFLYEVGVVEVYWVAEYARLLRLCFPRRNLGIALDLLYLVIVEPGEAGNDLDLIAEQLLGDLSEQLLHVMRVMILLRLMWIVVHCEEVL